MRQLFARMVRFYHIDPVRLWELSQSGDQWYVDLLAEELTGLEAREAHMLAMASSLPYMKQRDGKQFVNRLQRMYTIRPPKRTMKVVEYNPDKAREWFEARGITVIHNAPAESATDGG